MTDRLTEIIAAHKAGAARGVVSICSAHPAVLRAGAGLAARNGGPLVVESTCNQVNQDGGYSGMTPHAFSEFLAGVTGRVGLSREQVVLGGDHLGPYPWRSRPAVEAMREARMLVADCVRAGYTKIHLDASMPCSDDRSGTFSKTTIAERSAELCAAAEEAHRGLPAGGTPPSYVIGTEVPAPGGAVGNAGCEPEVRVTTPEDAEETIEITRRAFTRCRLDAAWERVVALVVQPGVDFGGQHVHAYDRPRAKPLSQFIERCPGLVYEAHSTDYQTAAALRRLVEDHFAILKVGPALTAAFREAVFALAWMEREWLGGRAGVVLSELPSVLERVMMADPRHWSNYYRGEPQQIAFDLRYSYYDRARYYWNHPEVQTSLTLLFGNLTQSPPPPALVSQFLPEPYARRHEGGSNDRPEGWVSERINAVLRTYTCACGWDVSG
jgi:D-tagatose-1,6-bisphosphate aldolase subunit GatZ/KbaZ